MSNHFKMPVYVLVDEYDAIYNHLVRTDTDAQKKDEEF